MTTIKSYTDINQSRKLAKILPLESADMCYKCIGEDPYDVCLRPYSEWKEEYKGLLVAKEVDVIPCWSLSALLNILHSKQGDIPSLSGGGYKDGKYISDWCLDYEFDNGDYQKTFADNPVDACYEMIIKLHEQDLL